MRYPVSNLPKTIPVGVQTESGVEEIGVDVATWINKWPGMELSVWLTRPGENASYPANNVRMDGTVLIWTPDAYDTERSGSGKFEILGRTKDGNKRKLTGNGVATMIRGTTLETTAEPGTAEIPWVEKVLSAAQEIKELLQYGPEHAGSMVYIDATGKLIPLVIGDGFEIVDGVLRLTGNVTPPDEPDEPITPPETIAFVEQEDGSILVQGVTFTEQEDGSILWDGATFTEQEDGSYLIS